jgi:hypothetical protein
MNEQLQPCMCMLLQLTQKDNNPNVRMFIVGVIALPQELERGVCMLTRPPTLPCTTCTTCTLSTDTQLCPMLSSLGHGSNSEWYRLQAKPAMSRAQRRKYNPSPMKQTTRNRPVPMHNVPLPVPTRGAAIPMPISYSHKHISSLS